MKGLEPEIGHRFAEIEQLQAELYGKALTGEDFQEEWQVKYHAKTYIGSKSVNQDNFMVDASFYYKGEDCEQAGTLICRPKEIHAVAVCDGVGGANHGELASKVAIQAIIHFVEAYPESEVLPDRLLEELLDQINEKIRFFRHLCENGLYHDTFWMLLAAPRCRDHHVRECLSSDEISLLLSSIGRETADGKRDFAAMSLAAVSGLRAGDIASLQLDDIDWKKHEIRLVQGKTSEPLAIPIPKVVLNAIADYILNGRPETASRNVFVRHCAPYSGYHDGVSIACIFRKYQKKAGLSHVVGDEKTLHGMRRGVGTRMVADGVPVDMVAQVLGHKGTKATKQYISTDMQNLCRCTLGLDSLGGGI